MKTTLFAMAAILLTGYWSGSRMTDDPDEGYRQSFAKDAEGLPSLAAVTSIPEGTHGVSRNGPGRDLKSSPPIKYPGSFIPVSERSERQDNEKQQPTQIEQATVPRRTPFRTNRNADTGHDRARGRRLLEKKSLAVSGLSGPMSRSLSQGSCFCGPGGQLK